LKERKHFVSLFRIWEEKETRDYFSRIQERKEIRRRKEKMHFNKKYP